MGKRLMYYWVYDGSDTKSYTNIHVSELRDLQDVPCYRGGNPSWWYGPYGSRDEAKQKSHELDRLEQQDHTSQCPS